MKANKMIALAMLSFSAVGCSKGFLSEAVKKASNTNGGIPQNVKVGVQVATGGSTIFDSSKSLDSSFNAKAGQKLSFKVSASNCPPGSSITAELTNSWSPESGAIGSFSSSNCSASGDITTKSAGVHTLTVKVHNGSAELSDAIAANISCTSPTFTKASISGNSSAISVGGSYGAVTYNASGVVAGANGQAPYRCAFDFNGDNIPDGALVDCSLEQPAPKKDGQPGDPILSTYVDSRPVNVIVADGCNTSYSVSKSIALPKTSPSGPGPVFVDATVNSATGCGDNIRVKGVHYLAHNTNGVTPCDPKYGGTSASIECMQSYGLPNSQPFGMKVQVSGLSNYDLGNNNGVIDASKAKVSSISYVTDEGGDAAPKVSFSGACSVSSVQADVIKVMNGTCSTGGGRNNSAVVQVWGTFTCQVSNSCGSAEISGKFSGVYNLSDGCSGGQGQGGDPKPSF